MGIGSTGIDTAFLAGLIARESAIQRCHSVSMVRDLARRRLPTMVFDFIDGAADDERTLALNRTDLDTVTFSPQLLGDVPVTSSGTTVLGEDVSLPILLGPTGLAGLHHPDGEIAAARAAESRGTAFTVSTMSSHSYRAVAESTDRKPWFQLYMSADRELNERMLDIAWSNGCRVLVVTIDIPVSGSRERDLRNGFTIPPRITPGNAADFARSPLRMARWAKGFLEGPGITLGTVADAYAGLGHPERSFESVGRMVWSDISALRERWKGRLVVKGVISARDARLSRDHGADGVIVSNHGGRQLDGLPSSISVLPEVVAELRGSDVEVLYDGAVRRGADALRALALGARAVLIGRPWAWGLGAAGQEGVERVLDILRADVVRVQHHLGLPHASDIGRDHLRAPWGTASAGGLAHA